MKIRRTTRDVIALAAIALICAAVAVSPPLQPIHGLSIDILTALRWEVFGRRQDPAGSAAVVIAIDEESARAAPFKGSPMLTWTGEIGRVLAAILEGGAKVAGFDVVIPISIEQSEIPFGEGMLGEKVRGFDRDFLRALATASASNKVVLAKSCATTSRSGHHRDSASPFASSRTSGRSTSTPTATRLCAGCR